MTPLHPKVDKTAPETTINSKPADPSNNANPSFSFSSNETGSTFQCSIDNGSFSNCTSPQNLDKLSDGSHTFQVKATDSAGNVEATPASYTWTIDRTAPLAPVITSPANNSTVGASFTLSGTAEANSTVELFESTTSRGTTQASASGNWSITLNNVSAGSHSYTAKATDATGNTSVASSSRTVIVDTTAPTATITSGPATGSTVNSTSASFSFSSNETGSTFECSLDGAAYTTCSSPQNYTTLSDGSHTFSVKATDVAGNTGTPASRTWTVSTDSVAPTTTASAKNADNSTYNSGEWTKQNVTVSLSATDSASGVKEITYSIDGGANTTVSGASAAVAITTEGAKTIKYHAVDNSGNAEADNTFTVKIDKTAPSITVGNPTTQPNAAGWYKTDVTNSFSASDGLSGLADATQASFQKSSSTEGSAVTISSGTVADKVGNVATSKDAGPFNIDKTAPVISGADVNDTTWRNTDRSASFTASDALSGLSAATDASFTLTASAES